ncbi:nuclease [Rhodosporidiobolus nylandii]
MAARVALHLARASAASLFSFSCIAAFSSCALDGAPTPSADVDWIAIPDEARLEGFAVPVGAVERSAGLTLPAELKSGGAAKELCKLAMQQAVKCEVVLRRFDDANKKFGGKNGQKKIGSQSSGRKRALQALRDGTLAVEAQLPPNAGYPAAVKEYVKEHTRDHIVLDKVFVSNKLKVKAYKDMLDNAPPVSTSHRNPYNPEQRSPVASHVQVFAAHPATGQGRSSDRPPHTHDPHLRRRYSQEQPQPTFDPRLQADFSTPQENFVNPQDTLINHDLYSGYYPAEQSAWQPEASPEPSGQGTDEETMRLLLQHNSHSPYDPDLLVPHPNTYSYPQYPGYNWRSPPAQ